MALLSSAEIRGWTRRLAWSGGTAFLLTQILRTNPDIGATWAIALAVFLADDMAEDRGMVFAQRLIIAMVATVTAMATTGFIRLFLD